MPILFQPLTQELKVDFFVKCQELLIKHHKDSPFVIREKALQKALDLFYENIQKYQGYCYNDENICVLWNHIVVEDAKDPNGTVVKNAYKAPNPDFNAVSIDFAVFRQMSDCLAFISENYDKRVKHILFIREGVPKLYAAETILKAVNFNGA